MPSSLSVKALIAFYIFPLCSCSEPGQSSRRRALASPVELVPPVDILAGHFYTDFGSIGVHLQDHKGQETYLFFSQDIEVNDTYEGGRIYIGLPAVDGSSKPVELEEESRILSILETALNHTYEKLGISTEERAEPPGAAKRDEIAAVKFALRDFKNGRTPPAVLSIEPAH